MIFLTTTAIDLDEELLNRCLVLTVDEDRAQTQAIHRKQREAQTSKDCWPGSEREEILRCTATRSGSEAARRGESLRARADVPRQPDAHAARSHEVS